MLSSPETGARTVAAASASRRYGLRMWPALATQTARPADGGGQRREGGGRGGGHFEGDPGRCLADQPRQQDEVVGVGGEDRFPGQRPGEEDRAVLGPERVQRGREPEAQEVEEGRDREGGDDDDREFGAPQLGSAIGCLGEEGFGETIGEPPESPSAGAHRADDMC